MNNKRAPETNNKKSTRFCLSKKSGNKESWVNYKLPRLDLLLDSNRSKSSFFLKSFLMKKKKTKKKKKKKKQKERIKL